MESRMVIPKAFLLFSFFLFSISLSHAQVKKLEEGQNPGTGQLSQLEWLTGYWTGEGFGGQCEEVWMPEIDGNMIGTFRFWSEEKLIFTEFMNLVQEGDTFSLKLKHYNPDLSGWEADGEWTIFRLVEVGVNSVWFDGLTMIRTGNEIKLHLALTENGVETIEELTYRRGSL
jgi:hypothetical protein